MVDFSAAFGRPFRQLGRFSALLAFEYAPYLVLFLLLFAILPSEMGSGLISVNTLLETDTIPLAEMPNGMAVGLSLLFYYILAMVSYFFIFGYGVMCAKTALAGKLDLPEWKNLWGIFVKGFKALAISLIYLIPFMFILVMFLVIALLAISPVTTGYLASGITGMFTAEHGVGYDPAMAASFLIAFLLSSPFLLLAALYIPMATINFVKHDKFGAAFRLGEITRKVFRWKYIGFFLLTILIAFGIGFASGFLGYFLILIPVIGEPIDVLVFAIVSAYIQIFSMTVWAMVYREK